MALEFATTLSVRDRATGVPASLVDIAVAVARWACLPDAEAAIDGGEWHAVGDRGADVRVERHEVEPGGEWAWQLRLVHPDREDRSLHWRVDVEAVEPAAGAAADTLVAVMLGRESVDRRLLHVRDQPAPPRVIQDLVEHPALDCLDGPIPITSSPSTLVAEAVEGFVAETLMIADRALPVVGVSCDRRSGAPSTDPAWLARILAGMAHVWLVPQDVTWALSDELPERLGVYNGAVRILWPGLNPGSTPYEHHLWPPDGTDPRREVVDVVARSALARFRPLDAISALRQRARDQDRARIERELEELRARIADPASAE